jgi:hypothetical protein
MSRSRLAESAWLGACLGLAVALALVRPVESAEPAAPLPSTEAAAAAGTALRDEAQLAGEPVAEASLPPGAVASPTPSDEIFPPQTITIRFDHRRHLSIPASASSPRTPKLTCRSCHAAAFTSGDARDRLLPSPVTSCDPCHGSDHRNREQVQAGPGADGRCTSCHLGQDAGKDGAVARFVLPRPNLRNSHWKHAARNIGCEQCHGAVQDVGLATRQQLPRMSGCFVCHAMSGSAQGEARGHCTNCHLVGPGGRLQTTFATGPLLPPPWLHGADHGPAWARSHRVQAAANSAMCANCHSEASCSECHDGKSRPRAIHPGDWLSMHAEASVLDNPRCTSCHQLQTFCADCHRRVGVARDGPLGTRASGRRFHPPAAEWSAGARGTTHHAWEAMRNLNACVSCHSERDCATCHASRGLRGGAGVSPHPAGFQCGAAFARNPRPCLVCHRASDQAIRNCP